MTAIRPVLLYHSVSDLPTPDGSWRAVSPTAFGTPVAVIPASAREPVGVSRRALGPEHSYAQQLIVHAVPRLVLASARQRDRVPALSAAAVVASLLITAGSFVAGFVRGPGREALLPRSAR
jgi:hypothetical protein